LAGLAGVTERITLGPLVACTAFRRPGVLARTAAAVDELSGGRLVLDGSPVVYLDGPGGSQTPDPVARAVAEYLTCMNANLAGPFATSVATEHLLHDARLAAADFLGCAAEEVVFGANTTTINFQLAHALARTLKPGDEIIVTELDHDANVAPWLLVAADHGLAVRTARLDPRDGTLDEAALEDLICTRTRVVACTVASNALGSIPDARRVAAAAHDAGALLWLDAVHLAPHRRLSRAAIGADVLLTSAYKYIGPHLGVAAVRSELARTLPADRVRPASEVPAGHRFETGTLCHEAIAGFAAAIEYLESLGAERDDRRSRLDLAYARIQAHESVLTRHTLGCLGEISGLRLYGIPDTARVGERTPTFCFNLDGWTPRSLCAQLADRGLFAYHGNYYALGTILRWALKLPEARSAPGTCTTQPQKKPTDSATRWHRWPSRPAGASSLSPSRRPGVRCIRSRVIAL
jgi:cysteine desulfurase family protein (TIGR01976 family)